MIKDDELGLKIAENPLEALWISVVEAREKTIKSYEDALIIERAFLELARQKASEAKSI